MIDGYHDNDRMNTFNFPWSDFRHFLQLMTTFWGTVYTVKKYLEKHSCGRLLKAYATSFTLYLDVAVTWKI